MTTINVKGMHCGGCAARVTRELAVVFPGAHVEIDLKAGEVRIEGERDPGKIELAISNAGYQVIQRARPQ